MGSVDLTSILYISFRLAPFIIVSCFSLSSIIHQDFKGLIYLGGLLFTCFIATLVGNIWPSLFVKYENGKDNSDTIFEEQTKVCNLITLTNTGPLSLIPLNITVIAYTFFYLLTIILKYKLLLNNIPTLVIFPLLMFCELLWNIRNDCSGFIALIAGIIIGGGCGALWSYMIDKSGMTNLKYYNGISTQVTCSQPAEQKFKCTIE